MLCCTRIDYDAFDTSNTDLKQRCPGKQRTRKLEVYILFLIGLYSGLDILHP